MAIGRTTAPDVIAAVIDSTPQVLQDASLVALKMLYDSRRPAVNRLPGRGDFEPRDLVGHLEHVLLLEIHGDGPGDRPTDAFRFRVFGSELVERWQFEMTGRTLADYPAEDRRQRVCAIFNYVLRRREPVRVCGAMRRPNGGHVWAESLLLPLAGDGQAVDMLLGEVRFRDGPLSEAIAQADAPVPDGGR